MEGMQTAATEEGHKAAGRGWKSEGVGHRRCPKAGCGLNANGGTLKSQERGWEWEGAGRPLCDKRKCGQKNPEGAKCKITEAPRAGRCEGAT